MTRVNFDELYTAGSISASRGLNFVCFFNSCAMSFVTSFVASERVICRPAALFECFRMYVVGVEAPS